MSTSAARPRSGPRPRQTARRSAAVPPRRELSELEGCVLGLVWSDGPCTPYHVQQVLAGSPSPHWSGSAGAIYPVFRRLEERGWIDARVTRRGRRKGKECRVSVSGRAALRRWLGPPVPEWVTELPIDPLRVRMRFLGALPAKKRARFLEEMRGALHEALAAIDTDCERLATRADPFQLAMARGAWHVTRARLAWVDEVADAVE